MTKTCLIVDDSSVVRKICKKIVEEIGFVTIEACDGQEALDRCNESAPDIVLLDWNMPVMDGLTFLKEFRPKQIEHGTVVIFCTTEHDVNKIMQAMEAGANEYIMKPFDAEIVKNKFEQLGLIGD